MSENQGHHAPMKIYRLLGDIHTQASRVELLSEVHLELASGLLVTAVGQMMSHTQRNQSSAEQSSS